MSKEKGSTAVSLVASNLAVNNDLRNFGLTAADVDARPITAIDIQALGLSTSIKGYKITYYTNEGLPTKYYRIRQLPDANIPGNKGSFIRSVTESNRIYFPINYKNTTTKEYRISSDDSPNGIATSHKPIIIVDDERLAVFITKQFGLLSVAIQGPMGWRNDDALADGFVELCERIINDRLTAVIWMDNSTDKNIQREVAALAMELKFNGVPFKNIRQYEGAKLLDAVLKSVLVPLSMFPKHPNIRGYIQEKLGDGTHRLGRKETAEVALAILSDLEARGTRIRSTTTNDFYYFDKGAKELISASLEVHGRDLMSNSEFMTSIYNRYGISPNDGAILNWLSTQYMSEEPIQRTKSYRVMMTEPRYTNTFALQMSPSEFVHFNGRGEAEIRENGDYGVLFERLSGRAVDTKLLTLELERQREQQYLPFWWGDVVNELRLDKTKRFKVLLALLYYVSPWLKGWRDMQLPIEVVTGEAGTGKSSIFQLRLSIITGDPELKGLPDNLRAWQSMVVNTSGICVFDNVHLVNKSHKQTLSDEMCRLTTEPNPSISMKQLYKTSDVARYPLQCIFGLTSIENVFTNVDFIQRAIIINLDRAYDSNEPDILFGGWVNDKLNERGGREAWLAHHIVSLERFFTLANKQWNVDYKSKTRLINFEQSLIVMAKVFGLDVEEWLPDLITANAKSTSIKLDWVLEGLSKFVRFWMSVHEDKPFTASDVSDWANSQEDFDQNATLTNSRRLGRYISTHKTVVRQTTSVYIHKASQKGTTYGIENAAARKADTKGKKAV